MEHSIKKRYKTKTLLEWERDSWESYFQHLPPAEQPYFTRIWDFAFHHDQIRLTGDRVNDTDHLWMGVIIEQQKMIDRQQQQIDTLMQTLKEMQ